MRAGDDDNIDEGDSDATSDNRHMDHDDSRGVNDSDDDGISLYCLIQAGNLSSISSLTQHTHKLKLYIQCTVKVGTHSFSSCDSSSSGVWDPDRIRDKRLLQRLERIS